MNNNYNNEYNNYNNYNNNYNPKKSYGSPISGILSLILIGAIIFVGLISFNAIDNPFTFMKNDGEKTINISDKEVSLKIGSSYQLTSKASTGAVLYKSSDENIVSVNEITGYIIGKKEGTATITAYLKDDNSIKDECTVMVAPVVSDVEVDSIKLSNTSLTLTKAGSKVLTYRVSPSDANIRKIYWSTSNKFVATVDKYGVVRGISEGSAVITLRTENGKTSKCNVTVIKKQNNTTPSNNQSNNNNNNSGNNNSTSKQSTTPSIALNHTSLSLDGGSTATLVANVNPSGTITWTSSNPRVAKVDSNGKVTANVAGSSTITATSNGLSATCTVNVSLNIEYHEIRYQEGGNEGTSIWYAIIPSKYKMHYAFGNDVIGGAERPSDVAKRVNATIAVNSQILGYPIINGQKQGFDANVSGYNFTVKQNPNFKMYDINTPPWDALIVTGTTDFSQGLSFKDINIGFEYEGDHVINNGSKLFMTLFNQLVMNRKYPSTFGPVDSSTEYYKRYYDQQELRQQERIPRTWIAYDSKGNQFVGVATGRDYPLRDGTQIRQHGLTYQEIIKITQKYFTTDIVTLFNMDGGGSSTFVYKGQKLNGNGDIDSNGNRYERVLLGTLYW